MNALTKTPAPFGLKNFASHLLRFMSVLLLAVVLFGCGKKTESTATDSQDPEITARLAQLTHDLRRAMVGRKLNRNFEEFVALRNLTVPPPPEGKKYVINEKWKVVLVDK